MSVVCSFADNAGSLVSIHRSIQMNFVVAAHWQSDHADPLNGSPRLLVTCLLGSVVLHAALLLILHGWWRTTPPEVPAVLDVVLMPAEVPQPVVPAAPQPTERTQVAKPVPVAKPAQATTARPEIAVAQTPAETALPAIVETARAPVAAPPAAAPRVEQPLTPPSFNAAYLRNPPPRYPLTARRNGDEGTVMLRVLVTTEGTAARVELDRTSGSASLDGAALEAVRNWRFVPARRGSQNVEDWVRVPVVFRLES